MKTRNFLGQTTICADLRSSDKGEVMVNHKLHFLLIPLIGIALTTSCYPNQITSIPTASEPNPTILAEEAITGWKIYRSEKLGYIFQYPPDATLQVDGNEQSISVNGPVVDDNTWPSFLISHPSDRADFRPPENANLITWLTDHNLLGGERMPDIQIAGTTAIHLRHERSPQSFAFDCYFFAKSGQLYMIVIGHSGDKENWDLYNHFLQSIRFER